VIRGILEKVIPRLEEAIWARQGKREGKEICFLCPGHPDTHPSARWNPDKQVWFCHVCHQGGGWRDLGQHLGLVQPATSGRQPGKSPTSKTKILEHPTHKKGRLSWREQAGQLETLALDLNLKAERKFALSQTLDPNQVPDTVLDGATEGIRRAFRDKALAEMLEATAFAIRDKGLTKERNYANAS